MFILFQKILLCAILQTLEELPNKKITDINTDKLSKFVEIGLLNVEGKNKGRKYRINKNTLS